MKLVPSPQGQAAIQLGGTWDKTANGPRYRDGKRWLFAPERFDRGQFQLAVGYPF